MARPRSKQRPPQGQLLVALRNKAGFTQTQLADFVGVSQQTIAVWEQSDKPPPGSALPKLANTLGIPIRKLFIEDKLGPQPEQPIPKLRRLFNAAAKMSPRRQELLAEELKPFFRKHARAKDGQTWWQNQRQVRKNRAAKRR